VLVYQRFDIRDMLGANAGLSSMTTRPLGSSKYSVFCGSRLRQSALAGGCDHIRHGARLDAERIGIDSALREERQHCDRKPRALHQPTALMAAMSSAAAFCASP
jgi:hypothetical protein